MCSCGRITTSDSHIITALVCEGPITICLRPEEEVSGWQSLIGIMPMRFFMSSMSEYAAFSRNTASLNLIGPDQKDYPRGSRRERSLDGQLQQPHPRPPPLTYD